MLDVRNVTQFNRTTEELEEFILFCFLNHGKNAEMQSQKLETFLNLAQELSEEALSPFALIRFLVKRNLLEKYTRQAKLGQYTRVVDPGFKEIAFSQIDLRTCSCEDLEGIRGISFKSSRYFILHSRPDQRIAVLDRHVLKWLRENGYSNAPKHPPQNFRKYQEWEKIFLEESDRRGASIADLDLEIWKSKQRRFQTNGI